MSANNSTGNGSSYGRLLSLFGRTVKPRIITPAPVEVAAPQGNQDTATPAFGHGRRVLIADDDPVFAKATENKLKSYGFEVSTASEGSAVLQAAREEAPDVILLDVDFPPELPTSWDGFTILEWLNQMNYLPNTPIIICTGKLDPEVARRATAMRAAGVLHKPLDYSELLGLIGFRLANSQTAGGGVALQN
jgi:CheY-like chemotaxis protein